MSSRRPAELRQSIAKRFDRIAAATFVIACWRRNRENAGVVWRIRVGRADRSSKVIWSADE